MTSPLWQQEEPAPRCLPGLERPSAHEAPIFPNIGKYLFVGQLSKSPLAEVFRVVHSQFQRDMVLKLATQPIGEDGRSDVVAEGKRLAALEHPHIVRVYDLDFYDGRPYVVMEYIRGRTLTQYARAEKLSPRRAAALMVQIAGAVAYAHSRGIVHQDIKPGNIQVDDAGRPCLIDFGLAWQEDAFAGTHPQSEGGTFAFMAPEQARLDLQRVRQLSDVFSVGAVLYFLLTDKAPFDAPTPEEAWERNRRCDSEPAPREALGKYRGNSSGSV